ncbi:MAG: hypothetical protein WD426_04420 [Anditalea sp.]
MENHIRLTLGNFSNALEMIRKQEMARYRKMIENSDREKISLVTSIMMAKIVSRLETKLILAAKEGQSEYLTESIEEIFSLQSKSGASRQQKF